MSDIENKFSRGRQGEFITQVTGDLSKVASNPKETVWDNQAGEDDQKSVLARRTVGAVAAQISFGMFMSVMGKNNKGIDAFLLNSYTFIFSLVCIGVCGFVLLLHKHYRSQTTTASLLFGLFSFGVGCAIGTFEATWGYSHFWMVLLLSITIGVDCLWFGLYRNRQADTIQRAMVVGTLISLILVTILVVVVEQKTKGEGQVAGASYLAIALGLTLSVDFYVAFDVCAIALPEADELEDWVNTAIHVYIDIFKALWMMIMIGVTAIVS